MKPQVPEGLRVKYVYDEVTKTPNGRRLPVPHRRVSAILLEDHLDYWPLSAKPLATVWGVGRAVAKEGPAVGERPGCVCSKDQFSRAIGRDIALGRAVKQYERVKADLDRYRDADAEAEARVRAVREPLTGAIDSRSVAS